MSHTLAQPLVWILYSLMAVVIVRSLLTWFPIRQDNDFIKLLDRISEPLLDPVRRRMPRIGMFDFSAMIVIVLLYLMIAAVHRAEA